MLAHRQISDTSTNDTLMPGIVASEALMCTMLVLASNCSIWTVCSYYDGNNHALVLQPQN